MSRLRADAGACLPAPRLWIEVAGSVDAARRVSARRRRRRTLLLLPLLFGLALPSVVTTVVTVSLFTETVTISNNVFSGGSIDLEAEPVQSLLTADGMMPGDHVDASLTVRNRGTASLLYAFRAETQRTSGAPLDDVIILEVRSEGTSCEAFDGQVLYNGVLAGGAFGNVLPGQQAGDRMLEGPGSEVLCFRATLPEVAGNRYQRSSSVTSLVFDAELAP